MKTGIAVNIARTFDGFENRISRVKELGYDCVDFQSFCDTDSLFFDGDMKELEKNCNRVRKIFEQYGIIPSQTHGPWRWPPRDSTKEEREERFEKMTRSLFGTKMIGCSHMVIHPIMPFGDNQNPHPDEFMKMNEEFFSALIRKAEEADVIIDFENMPMPALTLATPSQILEFVRKMNSPNMRVCLDTGHAAIFGLDLGECVKTSGKEFLASLHVHDNNGHSDQHLLPYEGVCNWENFTKGLIDIGFEGTVSLETDIRRNGLSADEIDSAEQKLAGICKKLAGR